MSLIDDIMEVVEQFNTIQLLIFARDLAMHLIRCGLANATDYETCRICSQQLAQLQGNSAYRRAA
jgi:hypothetical protein